ncbi:hypothetical protein NH344_15895, partial [Halomonas sp. Ps84H-12]|nr:hypothetical protein [Halomonas sp. Ps84H-12]
GVAGEGAATGAELYVGHGTVWVNGDNGYIAMQVSGLEVLPGAVSRIQALSNNTKVNLRIDAIFWQPEREKQFHR